VRRFDGQLPDLSPTGLDERSAWRISASASLRHSEPSAPGERIDHKVLLGELARLDVLDDFQWPRRAPFLYVEQAMQGLNYLLSRPDLSVSVSERSENLHSRLAAIPTLLEQGRTNLRGALVPSEFVEIALVACAGADAFLEGLDDADQARHAVADFERFLRND
jgi:hypothetical protein